MIKTCMAILAMRFALPLLGVLQATHATAPSLGEFQSQTDVGSPALAGSAVYDAVTDTYTVSGAGKNIWFDKDEFHFVSRRIKGDFILQTRAHLLGRGVEAHRKLGLMARTSLDTGSAQVNAVVHGDGLTSLQFRRADHTNMQEIKSDLNGADVIQLERHGNRYTMSAARFGEPFVITQVDELKLGGEVELGLFVCSHNTNVLEHGVFEDVRLTIPAHDGLVQYREYLGSRLELLDVETGRRQVVFRTADGIEAPNWTPDGAALLYNSQGKLFRFALAEKKPALLETGFATKCNNDHVLSFDGKILGISNSGKATGDKSAVYTLPADGGTPRLITTNGTSYLHGFSPDGKFLVFTGERGGEFDIYRIPVTGGEETRLTTFVGLDDGSEYSPDGHYIYFNSSRTGSMQLWRMKPDGSNAEQMIQDEFNNWFPHVSPDGQRIVFLSFTKDVPAEKHPYYERVYLREMPTAGGQPRVVAYLYGGQGTINVPSWNPDSRHLAFVSHTGAVK